MNNVYLITIRWNETPIHPPLIDAVMGLAGAWVRFNVDSWMLSSTKEIHEVRELLRKHLAFGDNFLIVRVLPGQIDGWAPAWVWEWVTRETSSASIAALYGTPTEPPPPPRLT